MRTSIHKKNKLPLFITVYEKLYDDIMSGKYAPGEQLPGEYDFARELNVSRGTLRQALLFLQEDRLIINKHGVGNFIVNKLQPEQKGIEVLSNLLTEYSFYPIQSIEHNLIFQPANKKQKAELNLSSSELVAFLDSYYYVDGKIIALGMIFIPYSMITENNVDVDNAKHIYDFYCNFLEIQNLTSQTEIQIVSARKSTAQKMNIEENASLLMIEETVFLDSNAVMKSKSYLLPDSFRLPLYRKNERKPFVCFDT